MVTPSVERVCQTTTYLLILKSSNIRNKHETTQCYQRASDDPPETKDRQTVGPIFRAIDASRKFAQTF